MAFVDYETKDGVAIITLNRPERLNALGTPVINDLLEVLQRFEKDADARVAIVTGKGRAFSAGADIKEMAETGRPGTGAREDTPAHDPYGLASVTKPTIAAVNGFAWGGGCHLVMSADIRIAAESASFGVAEMTLGLYGGGHAFVLQRIPLCVAMELSLTGDAISAQRAYEVGLVNKVVPDEELMPEAMKLAQKIAQHSPFALEWTKKAVQKAAALGEEVLDFGAFVDKKVRTSEDALEGVSAFMEKRKPVYKGK